MPCLSSLLSLACFRSGSFFGGPQAHVSSGRPLLSLGGPGRYRFWEVLGGVHTRGGYSRSPLVPTRGIANHVTMMAYGHHGLPPWWVHREACCSVQRGLDSGVRLIEDLSFFLKKKKHRKFHKIHLEVAEVNILFSEYIFKWGTRGSSSK